MDNLASPTNLLLNPVWGAAGLPGNVYTPLFHPPESQAVTQVPARTQQDYDATGDLWAVGVIFAAFLVLLGPIVWLILRR
jgi:hypothetical protein